MMILNMFNMFLLLLLVSTASGSVVPGRMECPEGYTLLPHNHTCYRANSLPNDDQTSPKVNSTPPSFTNKKVLLTQHISGFYNICSSVVLTSSYTHYDFILKQVNILIY